jgi:ubiquinone/menaquinone biosynthesis C-methylase UbiE
VKLERTASGLVIHSALEYDLRLWLRTRGRERGLRRRMLELARLAPGESLLDVGSATGSLAIEAKRRVGPDGPVHGIEPSSAMLRRARRKAARARVDVTFEEGTAQELPYDDRAFDVVTSTLVLHQLPHDAWRPSLAEMRRVLKPNGGRLLLVDISTEAGSGPTPHAHGHFDLERLIPLIRDVGLEVVEHGPVAFSLARFERLRYVLAAA